MAFINCPNVRIAGLAAGVPKTVVKTVSRNPKYSDEDFVKNVGVAEKRIDDRYTSSDLCHAAGEQLILDLGWSKDEIGVLVFISQYPDYIVPATSCILQNKLGLNKECISLDIPLGCSGWVYGLSTTISLLKNSNYKKAILLAGDARRMCSSQLLDPLFGFAGTATAIELTDESSGISFHFGSDGSGYESIIIPEGGARNRFNEHTLDIVYDEDGIARNGLCSRMNGMDVFAFAISTAPKSIKKLASSLDLKLDDVDFMVLHQANKKINDLIAKKLKFGEERVLESLPKFGNTSSASIPLSIITNLSTDDLKSRKSFITCGFGVGLSWGTSYFKLENCVISPLVEV